MKTEELRNLAKGDIINVRLVVSYVSEKHDMILSYLPRIERKFGEISAKLNCIIPLEAEDITSIEEHTRYRFKKGDLVRWKKTEYIVAGDESDDRQVPLLVGGLLVPSAEVVLLMQASELKCLEQKKQND